MVKKYLLIALFLLLGAGIQRATANDIDTLWMRWTTQEVSHVNISPDSKYIATDDRANGIVYDLMTGNELFTIGGINDVKFTPEGKYIYGYKDNKLVLVDILTRLRRTDIQESPYTIEDASITEDGKYIYCSYGTVVGFGVWEVETGMKIDEKIFLLSKPEEYKFYDSYYIGVSQTEGMILLHYQYRHS
jgi:WD40 repeat protein